MLEMGRGTGLNEQTLMIAMTLKRIDDLIKGFVKDVCQDMGIEGNTLFYKTEVEKGCYVLSLFRSTDNHMVKHGWTMEEFLMICSNKDRIEQTFNTVIRQLILNLDVNSDNLIWTPQNGGER